MRYRLPVLVLLLIAVVVTGCSDDDTTDPIVVKPGFGWSVVSPGTNNYLFDVCFETTGESYVAVGANGTLLYSSRSDQLHQLNSPTEADLLGVTSTGQEFVAVGDSGTIIRSTDGGTLWHLEDTENLELDSDDWLYGVSSSGSVTVAVGHQGIIVSSTDGSTWTRGKYFSDSIEITVTENLYGITYQPDSGLFVAVGAGGVIITSSNGGTWELEAPLYWFDSTAYPSVYTRALVMYDVTWAAELGLFVAVGQHGAIATSPDAHDWTIIETRPEKYFFAVEWSGDRLVIVGDDGWLLTSTDGETFTLRDTRTQDWRGIQYSEARERFVAVGIRQTIMGSDDGIEWEIEFDGGQLDLNAIACWDTDDTLCLAVGSEGTILKAANGVDWGLCFSGPNIELSGIAGHLETDTMIVAVGQQGAIMTSTDLVTWDTVLSKPVPLDLYAVTEGPVGFVAIGENGTIVHSADGVAWASFTDLTVTEEDLYGIASSPELYVAVGDKGTILTSTNGQQWTSISSVDTAQNLSGIAWVDTMFVAVGESGAIFTSTDGSSWTEQLWYTDDDARPALNAVAASEDAMVVVGLEGGGLVSEDGGLNWSSANTIGNLHSIVWTGNRFVAVGDYGIILTSP